MPEPKPQTRYRYAKNGGEKSSSFTNTLSKKGEWWQAHKSRSNQVYDAHIVYTKRTRKSAKATLLCSFICSFLILVISSIETEASTFYYDPTVTTQAGWARGTGTTYLEIDDGNRTPQLPNISDYIQANSNDNVVSDFAVVSISQTRIVNMTMWVYTATGTNFEYNLSFTRNGTTVCSKILAPSFSVNWTSCAWNNVSGPYTNMTIHLGDPVKNGGGGATMGSIYAAYLEVLESNPPNLTNLTLLLNGSLTNSTLIDFNFTVTDDINQTIQNCTLWSNFTGSWAPNNTITNIANASTRNFTLSLPQGEFIWNIICQDSHLGLGTYPYNFTVRIDRTSKDLSINSSNIWFGNEEKTQGNNITLFANVTNTGLNNVNTSFIVQFFDGNPNTTGVQIGSDIIVPELNVTRTITVNATYTLKIGLNEIFVVVDAGNSINETNESNNEANTTLYIYMYQIFYGSVNKNLVLGENGAGHIYQYVASSLTNGNVYFSDYDSSFDFSDLQAITRTTSGSSASNDFSEIDNALGTTGLNDSIINTWGQGIETPISLASFNVTGIIIGNVPTANSTGSGSFVTGILWDTADDSSMNGEYDASDKEDLVFITKINNSQPGFYGTYDYEARVPGPLKNYKPSTENLAYYIEIQ